MIEIIDQERFNILQFGKMYRMQKKCSITGKVYKVDLTFSEFVRYYRPKKKNVSHLKKLGKLQKEFLLSTLTPKEVKSLTYQQKKLNPKIWRYQLNLNKND